MIHAREDYMRIQDPSGIIPQGEPVLLLRGQDICAPETLRFYADFNESQGGDPEISRQIREHANEMTRWQNEVKVKVADLP